MRRGTHMSSLIHFQTVLSRMADPLSIAALTIAALEQLWNLGRRTAELISDFRGFDVVSQSYLPVAMAH